MDGLLHRPPLYTVKYIENRRSIRQCPASLLMRAAIRAGATRGSVSSEITKQLQEGDVYAIIHVDCDRFCYFLAEFGRRLGANACRQ
jgi:hypothetical protein